jgi:PPOX class probable FMN-dependent enzyme
MRIAFESPDQPEVRALIQALDDFQASLYPPEARYALDLATLRQPHVLFVVARDDSRRALGCAAVVLEGDAGELKRMYVHPDARGRGIGRALLLALEARARAQGCGLLRLETGTRQPEAVALYERLGFRHCGRFGDYPDDPHSVYMDKPLPVGRGEHIVQSLEQLASLYPAPKERPLRKQLVALERHSRRFIALSPFLVISTAGAQGTADASPRGGAPGFVHVLDDRTLLLPDAPGNNRLDSLRNIVETGKAGLLFMIPGVDETLRINGSAWLSRDPAHLAAFSGEKREPRLVLGLTVEEVYLHCSKAFMRSRLWQPDSLVDRSVLPTMGEMIRDQTGMDVPLETQEQMVARYTADL